MPTTDEELAELQNTVAEKRQRLIDARAEREANERSLTNDITAAQLKAEEEKLDSLIAEEEKRNSAEAVEAAAAVVLDPAASQQVNEMLHEAAISGGEVVVPDNQNETGEGV